MDQSNLLETMVELNDKSKPRSKKGKKGNTCESINALYEGWEATLNAFKSKIFPIKATND